MKLAGAPANCYAVLVGVEQYGQGVPGLSGPGMDALRLAHWLLGQGVPGPRLRLFVNFQPLTDAVLNKRRETLRQELAAAGAVFAEPVREAIDKALKPGQLPLPDGVDDAVLLLYFSGHGVCLEDDRDRLGITADAVGKSWEAINLELHARSLRLDPHSRRFAQQWLIQDACGQVVDKKKLSYLKTAQSDDGGGAAQYCFGSARRGEFSETAPQTQESLFTAALLRLLEGRALAGLDLEQLFAELSTEFRDTAQHPSLWRRNEHQEYAALSLGRASPPALIASLVETIAGLPVHIELLLGTYAEITADHESRPLRPEALVRELDNRVSADRSGLQNIELFALRLAARCEAQARALTDTGVAERMAAALPLRAAAGKLDGWLAAHGCNQPALTAERARLAQVYAHNSLQVVVLDPGDAGNPVRAWIDRKLVALPETLSAADSLQRRLHAAVNHLHNSGWLSINSRLELVIPARELHQAYIGQQIQVDPDPDIPLALALGEEELKVTVRVRERWTHPAWQNGWRTRWNQYRPALIQPPRLVLGAALQEVQAAGWRWIAANQCSELMRQLYLGEPFATWSCSADFAQLQPHFEQHSYTQLGLLLGTLAGFNRAGQFVTCVVDDFDRIPLGASPLLDPLEQPE